jgi:ketosteroid isomerase-like protein
MIQARKGAVMAVKLPEPIAAYFAAANTDDADRVVLCFAKDAMVRDEGGKYRGSSAIRAWAEEVRRKYRFYAEAIAVEQEADQTVVTAHLTGNFPGSPIDLPYRFTLTGAKIAALNIG